MYFNKNLLIYSGFILIVIASLLLRIQLFPFITGDYLNALLPWFNFYKIHGFTGFQTGVGDYNVSYQYFLYLLTKTNFSPLVAIKILSVCFDFVLAFAIYITVRALRCDSIYSALIFSSVILLSPTVFYNSALWGQCDALYTSFLVFSFYFVIKNKHHFAWLMWGISFTFKLQSIFFLPFLLYILLTRSKKLRDLLHPLIVLGVIFVSYLPSLIAGRSLKSLLSVYTGNVGQYKLLNFNAPNWLHWLPDDRYDLFSKSLIILTIGCLALLMVFVFINYEKIKNKNRHDAILAVILLISCPFLLPEMHERYFFTADIFAILLCAISMNFIAVSIGVSLISFLSYSIVLFGKTIMPFDYLAFMMAGILIYLLYRLRCEYLA